MKTIIAGSRNITDYSLVREAISRIDWDITEVVSGMAKGVDSMGSFWAMQNNIPVAEYPADWDRHGKKAGVIRNVVMAKHADALIAIWDGKSRGTGHMISEAKALGLRVAVFLVEELKNKNPIKNNEVFGNVSEKRNSTKSLTINIGESNLTVFEDRKMNPPIVNYVVSLTKEIDKLREELDRLKSHMG
jgi:hypothetical protein